MQNIFLYNSNLVKCDLCNLKFYDLDLLDEGKGAIYKIHIAIVSLKPPLQVDNSFKCY